MEKIEKYLTLGIIGLLPIFFLPIFPNPIATGKLAFLGIGILILLIVKATKLIISGKIGMSFGTFDLGVTLFLVSYLLSSLLVSPNKMDAFFLPGTTSIILISVLFYFLVVQLTNRDKSLILYALFASASLVSLIYLISAFGIFQQINSFPAFIRSGSFTPMDNILSTAIFLSVCLPMGISFVIFRENLAIKVVSAIATVIIAIGLFVSFYTSLPGKQNSISLPTFEVSWTVTADSLKLSPLLGVGPGNYTFAFGKFLPISYNQTPNWLLRFSQARNYYLTVITEAGLLGGFALALILFSLIKRFKSPSFAPQIQSGKFFSKPEVVSLILLIVILMFFPISPTLMVFLFILLGIVSDKTRFIPIYQSQQTTKPFTMIVAVPAIVLSLVGIFYFSFALRAEAVFKNALDAVQKNNAQKAYSLHAQAIKLNPYVDRYRASASQINLVIAQSIAQKKDVTAEERQTITSLLSESIREGKAAVTLNPKRASNWEILARTYKLVSPLTKGADQFAIQAYSQAIVLDPYSPNLRLALGGIYYSIGDFENAVKTFELAVLTKPDHANSRYNLAIAYREDRQIEKAIVEMKKVLDLVKLDSNDYKLAKKELEILEKRLPSKDNPDAENLTIPQASKQILNPPIELPEGLKPPIEELESSPTPTPSPTLVP